MFVLLKNEEAVAQASYLGTRQGAEEYVFSKEIFYGECGKLKISCPTLDATAGDEGYFIVPCSENTPGAPLIRFTEREDSYSEVPAPTINYQCYVLSDKTVVVLYDRGYNYSVYLSVKDGKYSMGISIGYAQQPSRLDLRLTVLTLPAGSDYNDCARAVREYKLRTGQMRTLKEKCAERPEVAYASKYPMVRIRMGWKPVPPTVLEQTEENEPPIHVAVTFKGVRDFADRLKAAGVEGAELTLVGWNIGGHDGRWPQCLPADNRLGGTEELIKTIKHVRALGYNISCHTNTIDSYTIANSYDPKKLALFKDGSINFGGKWGGGQSRTVCPLKQLDVARETLPEIAALGFRGLHYIDVLSVINIPFCCSKDHPAAPGEGIEAYNGIMKLSQELFGGFASEGGFDHSIRYLDYSLYNSFCDYINPMPNSFITPDGMIPMWELTYHGILLYNPCTLTVNYPIKDKDAEITYGLYGGKPSFYVYSKFLTEGRNWMGNEDFFLDDEASTALTVESIKRASKAFLENADLQLEFINRYEETESGLKLMKYENGAVVIGNYTDTALEYCGSMIPARSYTVRR